MSDLRRTAADAAVARDLPCGFLITQERFEQDVEGVLALAGEATLAVLVDGVPRYIVQPITYRPSPDDGHSGCQP